MRTVAIGEQNFAEIREHDFFLVDKTDFIRSWWQSGDAVTLICRPRRFGKTLCMSQVECFFSSRYSGRSDLFEGLRVWDSMEMRSEQGKWPVVSMSFASAKGSSAKIIERSICEQIALAYRECGDYIELDSLSEDERDLFTGKRPSVAIEEAG